MIRTSGEPEFAFPMWLMPFVASVLSCLISWPAVAADNMPVVFVRKIEDAGSGLRASEIEILSDLLRSRIGEGGRFLVIPPDQLERALMELQSESHKDCYDTQCRVELGARTAATKALETKILRLGSSCILTMTLWDLRRITTENTATTEGGCSTDSVMGLLNDAVAQIAGRPDVTASQGNGMLFVDSTPDNAQISLNGRAMGTVTPHEFHDLPAGIYTVSVETLEGRAEKTATVKRDSVQKVDITIPRNRNGSLYVSTTPPKLSVLVDGEDRGKSPIQLSMVPAGTHRIKIKGSYKGEDFEGDETTIVIRPDYKNEYSQSLTSTQAVAREKAQEESTRKKAALMAQQREKESREAAARAEKQAREERRRDERRRKADERQAARDRAAAAREEAYQKVKDSLWESNRWAYDDSYPAKFLWNFAPLEYGLGGSMSSEDFIPIYMAMSLNLGVTIGARWRLYVTAMASFVTFGLFDTIAFGFDVGGGFGLRLGENKNFALDMIGGYDGLPWTDGSAGDSASSNGFMAGINFEYTLGAGWPPDGMPITLGGRLLYHSTYSGVIASMVLGFGR